MASIRRSLLLTLIVTGAAGTVLGAWLVLAVQLASSERAGGRELRAHAGTPAAQRSAAQEEPARARPRELGARRPRLLAAGAAVAASLLVAGGLARRLWGEVAAAPPRSRDAGRGVLVAGDGATAFTGSPELSQLGRSLGRMVDELERRNRETARHRDELEAELLDLRQRSIAGDAGESLPATRPPRPERGVEMAPSLSSRRRA